ncbi:MAG: PilZ domain-containing protein [Planctomycetes bacterium]|nr:PilZ domain-containing protein [Planctomycetota bacterium]
MKPNNLQNIVDAVVRRAQKQGFVLAREVREELVKAGLSGARWKDVVALAGPALRYRSGRYYHAASVSERVLRDQEQQQAVRRAVRQIVRAHRAAAREVERREDSRVDFIQPVKVRTEDGREFALLSRDLSATGIRLLGTRSLLGQKVRVLISLPGGATAGQGQAWLFLVRILWTCAIGDDLFENGGTFMEVAVPS